MSLIQWFAISLFIGCFSWPAQAKQNLLTKEFQWGNGLRMVVHEDHRAPVAVFQIWYHVGSIDEETGKTGLSHMLEHLMFKGTERFPGDSFSKIIAQNGGSQNAATSSDYTVYYQQVEAKRLPICFELEADRMKNLTLTPKDFELEKEVVKEERRWRVEDNPNALLYERLKAAAHVSSGYHHPVIGWMQDIDSYSLADAKDWYRRWYGPNNATIVITGDVDPEKMAVLAKKYFVPIQPIDLPERERRYDQPPLGEKRLTVSREAKLPHLILGYLVPVIPTTQVQWEPYALHVLAYALGGGATSRLERELVRGQQLASYASVSYDAISRSDTLFTVSALPASGTSINTLEQAVRQQIVRLQEKPISEDELERVKTAVIAQDVYLRDAIDAQAFVLGGLEAAGLSWRLERKFVQLVREVTAEQVRQVARKYLRADALTAAILQPASAPTSISSPA